jgi:uncharacterized protein (TIGR02271 family)
MGSTKHAIEVNAPLNAVYNQWTQFEEFPHFMEGVEEVRQEGDKHLFWKAKIGGKEKSWEADIIDQVPDQRIAWESVTGAPNSGEVNFEEVDAERTRVTLTMNYEPEGMLEKAGDALGIPSGRVEGDLKRFRDYIESRGTETGGWRGEVGGSARTMQGAFPAEPSGAATPSRGASYEETTQEVPLTEEQLKVGKRDVAAGEIRVRKVVDTEQVNVPVELRREDAVIERIPAADVQVGAHSISDQEEIRVPLSREEAVVEKETRVTGGVRVRKTATREQQSVSDTVRREDVEVEKDNLRGERVHDDLDTQGIRAKNLREDDLPSGDKPSL